MTQQSSLDAQSGAPDTVGSHVLLPRAKPKPHIGRTVLSVVVVLAVLWLARSIAANPRLDLAVVWEYLFDPAILEGVRLTLFLAVLCMALATVVGLISALMSLSGARVLRWLSAAYIWLFRGTPVLVQLIIWFNLALLFPVLALGVPLGPELFTAETNDVITPIRAAIIAFTLAEGAFMSEIIRSGIQAVDKGQSEAARTLGMTGTQTMRRIVLPQAVRIVLPPTGNEFITMLKGTALAAVIAVPELLHQGQRIYFANFQVMELLIVVSIWYLVIVSAAMINQRFLESYWAKRI